MLGIYLSLFIALYLQYAPSILGNGVSPLLLGGIMIAIGLLFLFLQILLLGFALAPLQRAGQATTSRILELFQKDRVIRLINGGILVFTIFSIALAMDLIFLHFLSPHVVLSLWVLMLGAAYDAILWLVQRVLNYYNSFKVVEMVAHAAQKCVQEEKELDLCHWIEGLSEISNQAIQRTNISLCNDANHHLQLVTKHFLQSSKSLSHHAQDKQTEQLGIADKVSYVLFFILQRLEIIANKALDAKLDLVSQNMTSVFGKMILSSGQCDMSLATYSIHYMGKWALKAQAHRVPDIAEKATVMFVEVSKSLVQDVDLTYEEIKEPFLSLIRYMHELAKEMFRQDKKMSTKLLTQPFRDLRALFTDSKIAGHQDAPAIIADLDRVLGEFSALDAVLQMMPPIPEIPQTLIAELEGKEKGMEIG